MTESTFEPRIVGIFCNWCSYRAADLAGSQRLKYAPNVRVMRVMCSGRVEPDLVVKALSSGADAVMIAGCHPGECHYLEQNYKTMRRIAMIKHTLKAFGINPKRLHLLWASAAEGPQLAEGVDELVGIIRELGPLEWGGKRPESIDVDKALDNLAKEHAETMEVPK